VIAHADTKTRANPVKDNGSDYGGPAPEKKRRNGSKVGNDQENPGAPIPFGPIDLKLPARGHVFVLFF
jgi:hypothetical protein